jgi:hypothetical protein
LNVTYQKFINRDVNDFTASDNVDEFSLGYLVEFFELLFLDVVISWSDSDNNDDSNQDWSSFVPAMFQALGGDTQNQGDYCSCAQDSQHFVLEVFNNLKSVIYLPSTRGLCWAWQ